MKSGPNELRSKLFFVAMILLSTTSPPAVGETLPQGLYLNFFHGEKAGMGEYHDELASDLRNDLPGYSVTCVATQGGPIGKEVRLGSGYATAIALKEISRLRVVSSCRQNSVVVGPLVSLDVIREIEAKASYLHTYASPWIVGLLEASYGEIDPHAARPSVSEVEAAIRGFYLSLISYGHTSVTVPSSLRIDSIVPADRPGLYRVIALEDGKESRWDVTRREGYCAVYQINE